MSVDLLYTEDQQSIIDALRDVLRHEFSLERLRAQQPPFADGARSQWSALAELGWFSMGLAECHEGLGLSVVEECLLAREAGRHAVSPAVLASLLAAHLAADAAAASQASADLVRSFASGQRRAGFVLPLAPLQAGFETPVYVVDVEASEADGWAVMGGHAACRLVPLSAVRACETVPGLDGLVSLQRGTVDVARLAIPSGAGQALRAEVMIAAYLVGLAEATRDLTVDYAKVREQFGKAIGSFQAVKHRCADMAVACEAAFCQMAWAAVRVRDGHPQAARDVAAARLLAQRAAEDNASAAIQLHGAMGFTDEAGIHHFLKRALLLRHLPGAVAAADAREALLA